MSMNKILFYGADWCPDCKRSKEFLNGNKVDFEYIDIDQVPQAAEEVAKLNNGQKRIPTIVFEDESRLVEPNNLELKNKLIELNIL